MSKNGSDGIKRRTRAQHAGGGRVAKKVSTVRGSIGDPGPL
jgi:hypothetical protein